MRTRPGHSVPAEDLNTAVRRPCRTGKEGFRRLKIFRWMAVSFSLYSRIPMPRLTYEEGDMEHSLIWFPMVGAVIGALLCLVNIPECMKEVPAAVRIMLSLLIPVIITGGFHMDGFMDTEDAMRSYAPVEKKLEILKDPHIGAFAVIGLIQTGLILAPAVTVIVLYSSGSMDNILLFAAVFVIGRVLSGLTSLLFRKAKKDGMLRKETAGNRSGVIGCLAVWLLLSGGFVLVVDIEKGAVLLLSFAASAAWYRHRAYRLFGGVTGDTAGHFLVSAQTTAAAALAAVILISSLCS